MKKYLLICTILELYFMSGATIGYIATKINAPGYLGSLTGVITWIVTIIVTNKIIELIEEEK